MNSLRSVLNRLSDDDFKIVELNQSVYDSFFESKDSKESGDSYISQLTNETDVACPVMESGWRQTDIETMLKSNDQRLINSIAANLSVVIGPAIMMKFAALTTQKHQIHTLASLNTIMIDGTGMCGACRVTVGGKTKFVCIDGPEFDAHKVDFDEMLLRLNGYKAEECEADKKYNESISKEK